MSHRSNRPHPPRQPGIFVKSHVNVDDPLVRRQCVNKIGKYSNRKRAAAGASRASKKHGKKFRFYHCRLCGRYHLTSRPPQDFINTVTPLVPIQSTFGNEPV